MSRFVRTDDHGFIYIFGKETLFCDNALRELSLEQHITRTLIAEKYDLIVFHDGISGIRYARDDMRQIEAQLTNSPALVQRAGTSKMPPRRGERSRGPVNEGIPLEPQNTAPLTENQRLVGKEAAISLFDTLLDQDRRQTNLKNLKVAIIITSMEHWFEPGTISPNSYLYVFLNKYKTRLGRDLIILCFNGFTIQDAHTKYQHTSSAFGYLSDLNEWIHSLTTGTAKPSDNIIQIRPPDQGEIRNLLNRMRLTGQLIIPASQLDFITEEISRFVKTQQLSLGTLLLRIENHCGDDKAPLKFEKNSFMKCIGMEQVSKSSKALLDELVGLDPIHETLNALEREIQNANIDKGASPYRSRLDKDPVDGKKANLKLHFALKGKPGTGKTTVAELLGRYLYEIGALSSGHVVKCVAKDLIADHVGGTAIKTNQQVQAALGGVLFIDEISGIVGDTRDDSPQRSNSFAKDINGVLLNAMTSFHDLSVIIAGYPKDIEAFIDSDEGFRGGRFRYNINLPDYKGKELAEIFRRMAKKTSLAIAPELEAILTEFMDNWLRQKPSKGWGNAREVENLITAINGKVDRDRVIKIKDIPKETSGNPHYDLEKCLKNCGAHKSSPTEELDSLIGLSEVKKKIRELEAATLLAIKKDEEIKDPMNFLFLGNPGTGKTTVARLMGEMLAKIGAIPYSDVVEIENPGTELVDTRPGENKARKKFEEALGRVLFIDEAYGLLEYSGGHDVINTLNTFSENNKGKLCIILAGYPDRMRELLKANEGLPRRFPESQWIVFANYSSKELIELFDRKCRIEKYSYDEDFGRLLHNYTEVLSKKSSQRGFGNAGEMMDLFKNCRQKLAVRVIGTDAQDDIFIAGDILACIEGLGSANGDAKQKLHELIGLQGVKNKIDVIAKEIQVERKRGKTSKPPLNFVFAGNPGTGKITVAKLFGEILAGVGVLASSDVIDVKTDDLIGKYIGHTEGRTREVFESALGKVLFIDEAYKFIPTHESDYSQKVIQELVTFSENHQGNVCIILAGYPGEMKELIKLNRGLASRFKDTNWIIFEDYSDEDLYLIFKRLCEKEEYTCSADFDVLLRKCLPVIRNSNQSGDFGNGREMRNLLDDCKGAFASRVDANADFLYEFTPDDLICIMERKGLEVPGNEHSLILRRPVSDGCAYEIVTQEKKKLPESPVKAEKE